MASRVNKVTSISVGEFYERHHEALQLELVGSREGFDRSIREPAPNRPGLALAGFFTYFAKKRIQVVGNSELSYLKKLSPELRVERFGQLCTQGVPCVVMARDHVLPAELLPVAEEQGVAVFRTPMVTMKFLNLTSIRLEREFAESTSLHGCMVDFRGVGVLIVGDSGSGKSETAIGLLERGGALVADDLVRIRNLGGELMTSSPDLARGYIEMRGIGIINAANLYGLSAIRPEKRLDLVVTLRHAEEPVAAVVAAVAEHEGEGPRLVGLQCEQDQVVHQLEPTGELVAGVAVPEVFGYFDRGAVGLGLVETDLTDLARQHHRADATARCRQVADHAHPGVLQGVEELGDLVGLAR